MTGRLTHGQARRQTTRCAASGEGGVSRYRRVKPGSPRGTGHLVRRHVPAAAPPPWARRSLASSQRPPPLHQGLSSVPPSPKSAAPSEEAPGHRCRVSAASFLMSESARLPLATAASSWCVRRLSSRENSDVTLMRGLPVRWSFCTPDSAGVNDRWDLLVYQAAGSRRTPGDKGRPQAR